MHDGVKYVSSWETSPMQQVLFHLNLLGNWKRALLSPTTLGIWSPALAAILEPRAAT